LKHDKPLSIVFLTAAVGAGHRAAPLGAARLAAALKAASGLAGRFRVEIVEGVATDLPEALAAKAAAFKADLVGLSLYSWNSGLLETAGALVKAGHPGSVVVAGGPNASADPERLRKLDLADVVVAGEGEAAIVDIVRAMLDGKPLPGPVIRAPLLDPASLSSPWLDGTLDPARWGGAAVELTRGCPFRCSFCFESKGAAKLRRFPLELIAKEIARFQEARVEEVFVLDPTFNADQRRMADAIYLFNEHGPELRYFIELRAELLTAEQARLLSTLDCSVQIGLQSSDPKVLALVNRELEPERFAKKLRLLDEEGIIYGLDLIYGLPGDDIHGFKRSLDYALGLGPNHLDVFRLAVLPGTALHDQSAGLGLQYEPVAPYLVRSTPTFNAADLDQAERFANAVDVLYTKGRAVMWFRSVAVLAKARPSTLVARFADYLDAAGKHAADYTAATPHRAIEELQLAFLAASFAEKPPKVAGAAEAALDLVRVSGAWTRAFAEGERTELDLGWNPDDLLDYAMGDIAEFAAEAQSARGRWICAPGAEGPEFRKAGGARPAPKRRN
jgi:radical SAM superfamily enzyme YgiQ (UPF0313 family)